MHLEAQIENIVTPLITILKHLDGTAWHNIIDSFTYNLIVCADKLSYDTQKKGIMWILDPTDLFKELTIIK